MKSSSKQEGQLRTLVLLTAVLILVIAVQFFYRPLISETADFEEKISVICENDDKMKTELNYYQGDFELYEEEKENLETERSVFPEISENSLFDSKISKMISSSGLQAVSLEIHDNGPEKAELVYSPVNRKKGQPDSDLLYPFTEEVKYHDKDTVYTYETGIYTRDFIYTVSGKYNSILSCVRRICSDPSMEISGLSFSNEGDFSAYSDFTAVADIRVYMYNHNFDIVFSDDEQ